MRNDQQGSSWTSDVIATLRRFWEEGHSTAEIGRRMGVSKNAIVGKAHRLNLPSRPSPIRPLEAGTARTITPPKRTRVPRLAELIPVSAEMPAAPKSVPPPVAAVPHPPQIVERRPFVTIGSKPCCWPTGEPGTPAFRFCHSFAVAHKPYCEQHCTRAYKPPRLTSVQHGAEAVLS